MSNVTYGEVVVRFRPEVKERDFHIVGARIIYSNNIFAVHGENGACFMIPRDAVAFIGYTNGGAKINVEEHDSGPLKNQAFYNLKKDDEST